MALRHKYPFRYTEQMTQAAFAAVLKDNQILLMKPSNWVEQFSGHWNFPGGVVETGESLEKGAEREVFEETGLLCSVGELIDTALNEKYDTAISIYKAGYIPGDIQIQENEISEAAWFPLADALELPLAFDIKLTLKKLILADD